MTKQLSYFTQLPPLSVTLQRNPIFVGRDPVLTLGVHIGKAMFGLLSSFIALLLSTTGFCSSKFSLFCFPLQLIDSRYIDSIQKYVMYNEMNVVVILTVPCRGARRVPGGETVQLQPGGRGRHLQPPHPQVDNIYNNIYISTTIFTYLL